MAQLNTLNRLCQTHASLREKVFEMYHRMRFPYKIRCQFAAWIEQQDWSIDVSCDSGRAVAEGLRYELLTKIQNAEEAFELDRVMDMQLARDQILNLDIKSFMNAIKSCLQEERMLIESLSVESLEPTGREAAGGLTVGPQVKLEELRRKLSDMLREIINAEACVGQVSQDQERVLTHICEQNENLERLIRSARTQAKKAELSQRKKLQLIEHQEYSKEHFDLRSTMATSLIQLAIQLAYLLQMIWSEIRKWQNEQKYVSVGLALPQRDVLDAIDQICEEGSHILNRVVMQVEKAIMVFQRFPSRVGSSTSDDELSKLTTLHSELIKDYLPRHLHCLFIVEQNLTDGILCLDGGKSGQFKIALRFLGGKAFGLGFSRPTVKMYLKSERELNSTSTPAVDTTNSCIGGDCSFVVDMPTNRCRAEFQGVHIENLCPSSTNHSVSAHGGARFDKYAFLFQTVVHVSGRDIPLQTISLPVIVTNNQMDNVVARGVLFWDAAFSEPGRKAFVCKSVVQWSDFAPMLNALFVNRTGRELSPHHLHYLARLFFNDRSSTDFSVKQVKEKYAIYENMVGRKFSFWTWFWANLSLCRDIVNKEWAAGLLEGFMSKEDARNKLQDTPRGTFLLRFSETDIERSDKCANDSWCERKCDVYGHLTIAVIEMDPQNPVTKKLFYIKDYLSPKDLFEKGLSEILMAMEVPDLLQPNIKVPLLTHLWPDIETTFHRHFDKFRDLYFGSDSSEDENGYRRSNFAIQIFLSEDPSGRSRPASLMQRNDSTSSMSTVISHSSITDVSFDDTNTIGSCNSSSPAPMFAVRVDPCRRIATVNPQPSAAQRVQPVVRQMLPAAPGVDNTAPVSMATGELDDNSMDSVGSVMSSVSLSGLAQLGVTDTIASFSLNSSHS